MNTKGEGFFQGLRPTSLSDPRVSLIVANAVTIFLAMVQGWNLATTLLIYWFQSVTIGFFTLIQILMFREPGNGAELPGGRSSPISPLRNVGMAGFFAMHYGIFHLVYLSFILSFWFLLGFDLQALPDLLLACVIFFVNHLYSFLFYRGQEETENVTLREIFSRPYARIIPMHLTIILGGFVIAFYIGSGQDPSRVLVLVFLLLKTLADLWAHVRKHARVPVPVA
jgi:Family of unknown function (DUF6498)